MRFIHLSDLHIGKRVNEFSMLDDQRFILQKIIEIVDAQKPDAVLVAGDIYEKSVPSAEAVELFDDFLVRLSRLGTKTFIISGNHDSAERIAFAGRILSQSNVYVSPVYDGRVEPTALSDEFGSVNIYMLPFIKPANIRRIFPDAEVNSYTEAVKAAIENMDVDGLKRNLLITHQFVTGALRSDSEDFSVGGSDNVDAEVFEAFDYVALGHIHKPQDVLQGKIRYCGTPLKYSFSEASHKKSVTLVTMQEKGSVLAEEIPLTALHDMREIKGKFQELTAKESYQNAVRNDYVRVILTDENDIPDAIGRLRAIYPNIMRLDYDNKRTRAIGLTSEAVSVEKSPLELFKEFYEIQNDDKLSDEQLSLAKEIIEEIWEEVQ